MSARTTFPAVAIAGSGHTIAEAARIALRRRSEVCTSGRAALFGTATPVETVPRSTREPRSTMPACSSSSIIARVRMITSVASPAPSFDFIAPTAPN